MRDYRRWGQSWERNTDAQRRRLSSRRVRVFAHARALVIRRCLSFAHTRTSLGLRWPLAPPRKFGRNSGAPRALVALLGRAVHLRQLN